MVTDGSYICEHSITHRLVELLHFIPETNMTLCANYTQILKKKPKTCILRGLKVRQWVLYKSIKMPWGVFHLYIYSPHIVPTAHINKLIKHAMSRFIVCWASDQTYLTHIPKTLRMMTVVIIPIILLTSSFHNINTVSNYSL